ncbi:hypothetical protein PAPHI01_1120 [Pancytospora philotis]|nr:hypothetical protein PAPHI01_1120 [Pancytospora philotis]
MNVKLIAHAACMLILCRFVCATKRKRVGAAKVCADADPEPATNDEESTCNISHRVTIDLFNHLHEKCLERDEKRTDEPKLAAAENGLKVRSFRQQKMHFASMLVLSSKDPLAQFEDLLPAMSYGVMEHLYEELTSTTYTAKLVRFMRTQYVLPKATICTIRANARKYSGKLAERLLREIRPPFDTNAADTLRKKAAVNGPVDALMLVDWHVRQEESYRKQLAEGTKTAVSGLMETLMAMESTINEKIVTYRMHLAGILCSLLTCEDLMAGSLDERIENYIIPLMQMIFGHFKEKKENITIKDCKTLLVICASNITDDAVFKMFSWPMFRQHPTPCAAEFVRPVPAIKESNPYFMVHFFYHCFGITARRNALPHDALDLLIGYLRRDVARPDGPARLEQVLEARATFSKLHYETRFAIIELYYESIAGSKERNDFLVGYFRSLSSQERTPILEVARFKNISLEKYISEIV